MIYVLTQDGLTSIPVASDALIYIHKADDNAYDIVAEDVDVIDRTYFLGRYRDLPVAKAVLYKLSEARAEGSLYPMLEDDDDYWRN